MATTALKLQQNILKQITKDFSNFLKRSTKERTRNYVTNRLAVLEDNFKSSTQQNKEGIAAVEPGKEQELEETFEKIKDTYLDYKTVMQDCLDKMTENSSDLVSATNVSDGHKNVVRLPEINLPVFTGEYEQWRSFHDIFVALIHSNKALSNVEKLHYLKGTLGGEAERLLQHLAVGNENYEPAWEILVARYDHKRVLVNAQLNIFFNQENIVQESASGLKKLLDTSVECRHSLKNLGVPVEHWDVIIIYILTKKLPLATQQLWEEKLGTNKDLPKFDNFKEFLESRFRTLEAVGQQQAASSSKLGRTPPLKAKAFHAKQSQRAKFSCKACNKGAHALRTCNRFLRLDIMSRRNLVKRIGVCENCLAYSHTSAHCPSRLRCYFCQQAHHSLLHFTSPQSSQTEQNNQIQHNSHTSNTLHNTTHPAHTTHNQQNINPPQTLLSSAAETFQPAQRSSQHISNYLATQRSTTEVLLATTLVRVKTRTNSYILLRGLLDPGSEASFISEKAANQLGLNKGKTFVEISGLGKSSNGTSHHYVDLTLKGIHTGYETNTRAYIFKSLTGRLPAHELTLDGWNHLKDLSLADPTFHKPAEVDLLLGAEVFGEIILPEVIRGEKPWMPVAQNTLLGWILMGKVHQPTRNINTFHQAIDISRQLQKFWEIEETPYQAQQTSEEKACETFFTKTTRRLASGRYEVSLPFKGGDRPALGASKQGALRRFVQLERRFRGNSKLRDEYRKCMQEYLLLGHMEEVEDKDGVLNTPHHFFLPHHAVFKESSTTTKLRVVFDAAAKTLDGTSLNQHMMTGPKTQSDIIDIVLGWRQHKYTFTADIEKMYRQIRVDPKDTFYQMILWRDCDSDPIKVYRLKTVTFGTTCAPYLAIRTLHQLATDEESKFPIGARLVRENLYVDDLFAGADTIEEAISNRRQVNHLLLSGGFSLRKWASNDLEILDDVPEEQREVHFSLRINAMDHIKALGIKWFPAEDRLSFQSISTDSTEPTKRNILSTIAKLFDPLGWISPCVIQGKIIMQTLWRSKLNWDEPIPTNLKKQWTDFREELRHLDQIRIPRWINTTKMHTGMELHGFSDASERAYGAAIYLRVRDSENQIHVHLLLSKTRVAPVKTQTLPRLELCGAVMLATLLNYTAEVLGLKEAKQYAWTDSTITLAWIAAAPTKWTTFVSHRVAEIQRLVQAESWRHIPGELNPADIASRGLKPSALLSNTLWWTGPEFLRKEWSFQCPNQPMNLATEEEKHSIKAHVIEKSENYVLKLVFKYSNYTKIIRIMAYCLRFIHNSRSLPCSRSYSVLSPAELKSSNRAIIKIVQADMFSSDNKTNLPKSLCHFEDNDGILRVGGRLQNTDLSYNEQHPIILRGNHHFSKLIIRDAHQRTLHGGLNQTMMQLRQTYWFLKFKTSVKGVINHCVICLRYRAKTPQQLMGNLPAQRVREAQPFSHTGVDYAGPFEVKTWKGRSAKRYKGYFAIFICLVTKAIHIELVSDLTTQAFIAALRRFTARRGLCLNIFSDNGTTFVGANKELKKALEAALFNWTEIAETLAMEGIKWHFIPPASPHFGGLWEAGVKSIKYHLKRVIGTEVFTYEELTTLLHQIEACLNSRPLCPLTENPQDFTALTPAHFLIGRALKTIPEPELLDININLLQRWQRLQKLQQSFWKKWKTEYLTRLQHRPKWMRRETPVKKGDMVILKDENLPPSRWSLARVIETHPGSDGLVRVVTLQTKNGQFKRPITKMCLLPCNEENTTSNSQQLITDT